jgi:uncharacterized protein (DUF488 family)
VKRLATIGFGKKSAERFISLLQSARIDTVLDTRRRPDSALSGYARSRDLPYILSQAGLRYEYMPELAPADELLQRYRSDQDWPRYVADYTRDVLNSQEGLDAMRSILLRSDTVALLCSEPTPDKCHRRLAAERIAELEPVEIIHLV